jgi:hypothetical protein
LASFKFLWKLGCYRPVAGDESSSGWGADGCHAPPGWATTIGRGAIGARGGPWGGSGLVRSRGQLGCPSLWDCEGSCVFLVVLVML